jgi:hypothetical protein
LSLSHAFSQEQLDQLPLLVESVAVVVFAGITAAVSAGITAAVPAGIAAAILAGVTAVILAGVTAIVLIVVLVVVLVVVLIVVLGVSGIFHIIVVILGHNKYLLSAFFVTSLVWRDSKILYNCFFILKLKNKWHIIRKCGCIL